MGDEQNKIVVHIKARWGRLLSIEDAAEYLGISPKTIRNQLGRKAEKKFPVKPRKYGRRTVFDRKELDKLADHLPTLDT